MCVDKQKSVSKFRYDALIRLVVFAIWLTMSVRDVNAANSGECALMSKQYAVI